MDEARYIPSRMTGDVARHCTSIRLDCEKRPMREIAKRFDAAAIADRRALLSRRVPVRTELLRQLERVVIATAEPSLKQSRVRVARSLDFASWDDLHRAIFASTDAGLRALCDSIGKRLANPDR
ncbi:hypothetical protein [Panacagrimonas perspica]|nr:hypothetical protein [Panacagrimonas perspica]